MEYMTKDEYVAFVVGERERAQKSHAELMAHVVAQFTSVLRELHAPETVLAPSPEEVAKQAVELRKRIRDGFAAAALHGLCANSFNDRLNKPLSLAGADEMAMLAYEHADAMLAEREKS